jgi:hypothetical protein
MGVVMDMSSYTIEHNDDAGYGDEVLCSGWNPALALACAEAAARNPAPHDTMPASLANADAETFLQKMYACQG